MLTCATHPSINLYWCSSPTWKPFCWPSASPAWSSRQLLIYAEYWVCSSSPFGLHFYLSLQCDLRFKMNPPSTISLISHPVLHFLRLRPQKTWGTVPAEASRRCVEQEKEERQERAGRYLGHWLAQRDVGSRRYTEEGKMFHYKHFICSISEKTFLFCNRISFKLLSSVFQGLICTWQWPEAFKFRTE